MGLIAASPAGLDLTDSTEMPQPIPLPAVHSLEGQVWASTRLKPLATLERFHGWV